MSWWDDLWLNEGFASYMKYLGVENVHPDWQMVRRLGIAIVHSVFAISIQRDSYGFLQLVMNWAAYDDSSKSLFVKIICSMNYTLKPGFYCWPSFKRFGNTA